MACADLHCHTTCSDGLLSPADLVARAAAHGVDLLAVTDHDTTAGIAEARRAAAAAGVTLVPGVEISVSVAGRVVHVLGLGVDPDSPDLARGLARLESVREGRAGEMAARLERIGIGGSLEGAAAYARPGVPGRGHFARYLVENGHAPDMKRAFKRFLQRGAPAWVSAEWAGLEEALAWIRAAGGRGVLAHPARYGMTRTALRRLLGVFRDAGGEGMEVISGNQTPDLTRDLARQAGELDLYASRGSDFHGPGAGVELGRLPPLPQDCIPLWQACPELAVPAPAAAGGGWPCST